MFGNNATIDKADRDVGSDAVGGVSRDTDEMLNDLPLPLIINSHRLGAERIGCETALLL